MSSSSTYNYCLWRDLPSSSGIITQQPSSPVPNCHLIWIAACSRSQLQSINSYVGCLAFPSLGLGIMCVLSWIAKQVPLWPLLFSTLILHLCLTSICVILFLCTRPANKFWLLLASHENGLWLLFRSLLIRRVWRQVWIKLEFGLLFLLYDSYDIYVCSY